MLASSPLHGTLVLGQIYPILLVGLVAGWIAERRGRPVLAAVLYGVVVALKPSLAPVLLLAAVQRRWQPLRAGIAAAAAATLVGVLAAGPSSALGWLRLALGAASRTSDNASLPGLAPGFGLPPAVGTVLGVAALVGTLAWCARHRDRVDPAGTAPWAVLAAGLLLAPIAWHNYLMLLWPGVLVLIALGRGAAAAAALAVAVVPVSWAAEWPPESRSRSRARCTAPSCWATGCCCSRVGPALVGAVGPASTARCRLARDHVGRLVDDASGGLSTLAAG